MRLVGIGVPGDVTPWEEVGFTAVDGAIPVANGALLVGVGGLVVTRGSDRALDLEGIPVAHGAVRPPVAHPNGAFELDHLVLLTNSLERTSDAVHATLGLECRRVRETPAVRQAFHRFDDVVDPDSGERSRGCIIEIVERAGQGETSLMGVVFTVTDLDALADRYDQTIMSRPKDAVQPGRRIAAFRAEAGLPVPVAVMTR